MIISNVKVPVRYTDTQLEKAIRKASGDRSLKVRTVQILKRSIDARKKPQLFYVMKLAVNEKPVVPEQSPKKAAARERVFVAGAGPAGLFAALTLQKAGLDTILLERGKDIDRRTADVEEFWRTGLLDPSSNVQFGEGGAGTFSDGKLNTMTRDPGGLNARVLYAFYRAGAPETILYDAKPHIGTDRLKTVVKNLREEFLSLGGSVLFETELIDIETENGALAGLITQKAGMRKKNPARFLVLAPGHSARNTFYMLQSRGLYMEAKPFAVGVRMEHPQKMITQDQYGSLDYEELGAAPYKVTAGTSGGRGVYSFCMCPGGYVVNASSEEGRLCVNGMSCAARDSENANAAIVVQVTPDDYPGDGPLAGIEFQRILEERAFRAGKGKIPVQLLGDFMEDGESAAFGQVKPCMKGAFQFGKVQDVLPEVITGALREAIPEFGRMIGGFDRPDALLSAVEARTSSPVRIVRDEKGEANIKGIYPCGEGAGYAGGITSAAMDGIRMAEKIIDRINCENG